jgi:hypothetical protein
MRNLLKFNLSLRFFRIYVAHLHNFFGEWNMLDDSLWELKFIEDFVISRTHKNWWENLEVTLDVGGYRKEIPKCHYHNLCKKQTICFEIEN